MMLPFTDDTFMHIQTKTAFTLNDMLYLRVRNHTVLHNSVPLFLSQIISVLFGTKL